MKRGLAYLMAMTSLMVVPALAALGEGAKAPDFSAKASLAGDLFEFSLADALAKGPVVLYFYPAAYTKGCDLEARTFAMQAEAFAEAGATIIGMSADSPERLKRYSADPENCAGKFAVAADPEGQVAAQFGLTMSPPREGATDETGVEIEHGFLPRTTFVIAADGSIVKVFSSEENGLRPDEHVHKSLEIVRELNAGA